MAETKPSTGAYQEFDLGGYKWVKETKQPHKKIKVDWLGGIHTDIPPPRSLRPWPSIHVRSRQ